MKTIALPASISELSAINATIEKVLENSSPEYLFKTQLIVEELLTNIAKYSYEGKANKTVNFVCGYVYFDGKKSILIQLTDNGLPFDPFMDAKTPDVDTPIEDRQIGGLGLFLVKEVATHYTYARIDGINQIQIYLDIKN